MPILSSIRLTIALVAVAVAGPPAFAGEQTTVLRKPVAAVAIGPSQAKLTINELSGAGVDGTRHVTVRKPVLVLAHPLRRAQTRVL